MSRDYPIGKNHPADIVWDFPFSVAPLSQAVSAATFTNRLEPPCYILDTTTPGANKIAEYVVVNHDSDDPFELKFRDRADYTRHMLEQIIRVSSFLGIYTTRNTTTQTDTQYAGIEIGSIDMNPPFTNPASGGVCQVRWIGSSDSWELFTAKGDGSDPVRIPLAGCTGIYDSSNIPHGAYVSLESNPFQKTIRAYVNGVLGATYRGDEAFPDFAALGHSNGSHQVMSGIFVTTGSSASGRITCFFNSFRHEIVGFLDGFPTG